jgi:2-dehydro-3-deoxygalactonokinase
MAQADRAALIGIDWGTTSLRAWKVTADGTVLDTRRRDLGILRVPGGDFPAAFAESVGDWHADGLPVLMSGMIGSRQGWAEAAYVPCPADTAALAAHLLSPPGVKQVWIVPGVSLHEAGRRDVMRGEETQIAGALGRGSGVVILPGTHSKWVHVEDGRIADFATFMTGELFDVLVKHSILGRLMTDKPEDDRGFSLGIDAARKEGGGGLSGALFSARTLGLFGDIPAEALRDYLSGLLIGHEVREALARFPAQHTLLIGAPDLARRYDTALRAFGVGASTADEGAAVRGLLGIARQAGLLEEHAR